MKKNVFVLTIQIILTICIVLLLCMHILNLRGLCELSLGITVLSGICFLISLGMAILQNLRSISIGEVFYFAAYLIKYLPILPDATGVVTDTCFCVFLVCSIFFFLRQARISLKQKI